MDAFVPESEHLFAYLLAVRFVIASVYADV